MDSLWDRAKYQRAEEVKRVICAHMATCDREFRVDERDGVDPVKVLDSILIEGSPVRFMISQMEYAVVTENGRRYVIFKPNYVLGEYLLKTMHMKTSSAVNAFIASYCAASCPPCVKVLICHNYLADTVTYDWDGVNCTDRVQNAYTHSAYGALIKRTCVCQGIADAVYQILNAAGVECTLCTGMADTPDGSGMHTWNLVKLQNQWYHMDVTWDLKAYDRIDHTNFLRGDAAMSACRQWDRAVYPACPGDGTSAVRSALRGSVGAPWRQNVPERYLTLS